MGGALLVLDYGLPFITEYDADSFNKQEIEIIEKEIDISCLKLHEEAMSFSKSDIGEIINQGLKGNDWVAVITSQQKSYIEENKEKLYQCNRAKYFSDKLRLEWPDFSELHQLYSALSTFSTTYGEGPATANDLKPEALDRLRFIYLNVTSQSTRTQ